MAENRRIYVLILPIPILSIGIPPLLRDPPILHNRLRPKPHPPRPTKLEPRWRPIYVGGNDDTDAGARTRAHAHADAVDR